MDLVTHREQNGVTWSHFRFELAQGTHDFWRVFGVADISKQAAEFGL